MDRDIKRIVVFAGIIIIPVGSILFRRSYYVLRGLFKISITLMVATVVERKLEWFYLLKSTDLVLSSARLVKKMILLYDMKSVEILAFADVICVDKTGTITTSYMFAIEDILGFSN